MTAAHPEAPKPGGQGGRVQPVVLRTERLTLSVPTEADVDAIFEACQDAEIRRYTTVPSPYERQHAVG